MTYPTLVVGGRFSPLCDFPEDRAPVTVSAAEICVITADFRVSDLRIDVICGEIAVSPENGDSGEPGDSIYTRPSRNSPGQGPVPICLDHGFEVSADVRSKR